MPKFLSILGVFAAALLTCSHSLRANDFEPAEGHYIAAADSTPDEKVTFSFHEGKITLLKLHGKYAANLTPLPDHGLPENLNHNITVFRRGFSGYYHRGGFARYHYWAKWTHHGVVEGEIVVTPAGYFARAFSLRFKSHLQHHGG